MPCRTTWSRQARACPRTTTGAWRPCFSMEATLLFRGDGCCGRTSLTAATSSLLIQSGKTFLINIFQVCESLAHFLSSFTMQKCYGRSGLLWQIHTFMLDPDFYDRSGLLWRIQTFMTNPDFYSRPRLLWRIQTFMTDPDFYDGSRLLWRIRTSIADQDFYDGSGLLLQTSSYK